VALNFDYKYLDSGHSRPPVLEKRLLINFASFSSSLELFKMLSGANHLCFNVLSDHRTLTDTINCLPADYNITVLQESFPDYAKNCQKSYCLFIIYNGHKQRQIKYSFFLCYPTPTITSIDRCLRIREH